MRTFRSVVLSVVVAGALVACSGPLAPAPHNSSIGPAPSAAPSPVAPDPTVSLTVVSSGQPVSEVVISAFDDAGNAIPLASAELDLDDNEASNLMAPGRAYTDVTGKFVHTFAQLAPVKLQVRHHDFLTTEVEITEFPADLTVDLTPIPLVRAIRAAPNIVADDAAWQNLLQLVSGSNVNALVFDTKDEAGQVRYATDVQIAHDWTWVNPFFDVPTRLAEAAEVGAYPITRIVVFKDENWAAKKPEHVMGGHWIDASNRDTWELPFALAVEACELGFEEVQFDYVRFSEGKSGRPAWQMGQEARVAAIVEFLDQARQGLHPYGCAVSADIFGIVMSTPDDQGLGQRLEDVAAVVDAVSPMIYPSHYSAGWRGWDNPNNYPGPVVADALDTGIPRVGDTEMRPWVQAFYYNGPQVLAQIEEAEARGAGWILWHSAGTYDPSWLPVGDN